MKKEQKPRGAKGEGSLFKRKGSRFWHFKAPNGERFPTGTQIKSEATDFKLRKLTELRTGQPHIVSKAKGATVNELLDAHLAYMRRKGRKSTQDVEWVLDLPCALLRRTYRGDARDCRLRALPEGQGD